MSMRKFEHFSKTIKTLHLYGERIALYESTYILYPQQMKRMSRVYWIPYIFIYIYICIVVSKLNTIRIEVNCYMCTVCCVTEKWKRRQKDNGSWAIKKNFFCSLYRKPLGYTWRPPKAVAQGVDPKIYIRVRTFVLSCTYFFAFSLPCYNCVTFVRSNFMGAKGTNRIRVYTYKHYSRIRNNNKIIFIATNNAEKGQIIIFFIRAEWIQV